MGEYYVIANVDKKEYVSPPLLKLWEIQKNWPALLYYLQAEGRLGDGGNPEIQIGEAPMEDGRTMLETKGEDDPPSLDMEKLRETLQRWWPNFGRWGGDSVRIIGSHARERDWSKINESTDWTEITDEVLPEVRRFQAGRDTPPDADPGKTRVCAPDLVL